MNPTPFGNGLSLAIDESDNSLDFELALSVAEYFRITLTEARSMRTEVLSSVSKWREYATALKISKKEQEAMSSAFKTTSPA